MIRINIMCGVVKKVLMKLKNEEQEKYCVGKVIIFIAYTINNCMHITPVCRGFKLKKKVFKLSFRKYL